MRKSDLFASNSSYAYGRNGLSHYAISAQREHMEELVEKAKCAEQNAYCTDMDVHAHGVDTNII